MSSNPATSIVCYPYLSADDCDRAIEAAGAFSPGRISRPDQAGASAEDAVRSCTISHAIDDELRDRILRDVLAMNARVYQFAIEDSFHDDDPLAVMRYEPDDHFVWHIDNAAATPPLGSRKLSFSIQLSDPADYDGGDLEIGQYAQAYGGELFASYQAQIRTRGAITIFPSFTLHRVSPVTRGVRHALVGWLHGPAFR